MGQIQVPVNKLQKYLKLVLQKLGTLPFPDPNRLGFHVKKLVVTNLQVGKKNFISLLGLFSPEPPIYCLLLSPNKNCFHLLQ